LTAVWGNFEKKVGALGGVWGHLGENCKAQFWGDSWLILGSRAGRSRMGASLGKAALAIGKLIAPAAGLFKPRDDRHILESQMPKGLGC